MYLNDLDKNINDINHYILVKITNMLMEILKNLTKQIIINTFKLTNKTYFIIYPSHKINLTFKLNI